MDIPRDGDLLPSANEHPATRVLWRTTDGWSLSTEKTISDRCKSRGASPK